MSEQPLDPQAQEQEDNKLIAQRKEKLSALRDQQAIPFPNDFRRDSLAGDLQKQYADKTKEELEAAGIKVKVAGRNMLNRGAFMVLQDTSGRIQVYVDRKTLPAETLEAVKTWDLGDIIATEGTLARSGKGDLYVNMSDVRLLTKSLRPLPDKHHGLTDTELRYRQRYVDLIVNEEVRQTFRVRSQVIAHIRRFLMERGFLEVETPMLQTIPGGAAAKPFETHHNALDMAMFLRIAPELYLKRLVVGGFEKVFEINRNFRNEGVSTRHNPEFTMLEWYRVGWNHHQLVEETVALVRAALALVGREASLTVIDYRSLYRQQVGVDPFDATLEQLQGPLADVRIDADGLTRDDWLDLLMTHCIQPHFRDDTLTVVHDWPASQAALARIRPGTPPLAERFELYLGAVELANGYHELNDADEQRARFVRDHAVRTARGAVLPALDEHLLAALPALPDCAGVAVGVDRLLMAMNRTGRIADVLAFDFAHA